MNELFPAPSPVRRECRCDCGNLLARLGPEGVELKCRRCKREVVIPWNAATRWQEFGAVQPTKGRASVEEKHREGSFTRRSRETKTVPVVSGKE